MSDEVTKQPEVLEDDASVEAEDSSKGFMKLLDRFATGITLTTLSSLFLLILLWQTVVVYVYPGEQGVYWSRFLGGTTARFIGEGAQFKLPWDQIFKYDVRIQEYGNTLILLSKDGLEMEVKWSVRYQPDTELLHELHQSIGPGYALKVVIPESVSSLRQVLGNYKAEEIFAYDEASLLEQLAKKAEQNFGNYPIKVKNIHILQLKLPDDMANGIVQKMLREQELLSYEYRIKSTLAEKERLKTEAEGLRQFEEISKIPILKWRGIDATVELAKSENSKIIVIGTDSQELPLLLNSGN